ncbi:MAG: hypothetical protein Q8N15_02430 [Bacillota bacterium]|nr:hypothetical protein [Bacillota bacterium]
MRFEDHLYEKIKKIISLWPDEETYAISFFVYSNESHEFGGFQNLTEFFISYNTEADCERSGRYSEKRWNYAFWRHDAVPIVSIEEEMPQLIRWYNYMKITNIGSTAKDGGHPIGHLELFDLAASLGRRLQEEGFLLRKYGRPIPIIVHELEYYGLISQLTARANPNGEANDFIQANENWFCEDSGDQDSDGFLDQLPQETGLIEEIIESGMSQSILGALKDFQKEIVQMADGEGIDDEAIREKTKKYFDLISSMSTKRHKDDK